MVVALSRQGSVAIVTIDNPPVNATSQTVRQALWNAVYQTEVDETVSAVVLCAAGRTFVAGADVKEFGKPPAEPHLPDLITRIEKASKPWVAAIHGTALGGGLELALACHHRIADQSATLGLPEVTLGVIPGAGGTVRLPRLVDAEIALEMIATGKPISAPKALDCGLVDALSKSDLLADALALAHDAPKPTPLLERPTKGKALADSFDQLAAKILSKTKGQSAPKSAVQAIRNAYAMSAADALNQEREMFLSLKDGGQSAALRYIFFAERATRKIDRIKDIEPQQVCQIGVVGGGTMGAGISAACLLAGFRVVMVERDAEAVANGQNRLESILTSSFDRGLISAQKHEALLTSFTASDDYHAFADCDLIIEAVFEDMNVKKQVFADIEAVAKPTSILATNTSYLDVNELAESTNHPNRVIGLHFFSPAHIMKLLEIVVPNFVDDMTLATSLALSKKLRKIPVISGVCDGFIANRIMSAYRKEAEYMIEDGAMPWDVDQAMVNFGFPIGIFQMGDLAGLDISWAMRKRKAATRDPGQRYVDIADKLCEMGRFGRKSGRGYYLYQGESGGNPDPEVEALIIAESLRKGIQRVSMNEDVIMSRILNAMQSEGKNILTEGIARSPEDIDVVMVNAYGFPRWRGGAMFMQKQEIAK